MKAPGCVARSWLAPCLHAMADRWLWKLTWNREENNLLVGPLLGGIVVDRNATGCDVAAFLSPWNVPCSGISVGSGDLVGSNSLKDYVTRKGVAGLKSGHD